MKFGAAFALIQSCFRSGACSLHMFTKCLSALLSNAVNKVHLKQIHSRFLVCGLQFRVVLITKLVQRCSYLGEVHYARNVFESFPDPDVFLYNAIMKCYSRQSFAAEVVRVYVRMRTSSVNADSFTFPCVLKACGELSARTIGRCVHAHVFRHGLGSDLFAQNGLVSFYARCGELFRANTVFWRLQQKTIVSWTSMIAGYAQNDQLDEALRVFMAMWKAEVGVDWITLVSILKVCSTLKDLIRGQLIHTCVIKLGCEDEFDINVSLTAMYAKCGNVSTARSFFDKVKTPELMLWNSMISGYVKNGLAEEALDLFRDMVSKNIKPDSITVTSCCSACSQLGSLELARWMDDFVKRNYQINDVYVNTALIDMYTKCGNLDFARSVFDRNVIKDVVLWSAMIFGYALHGCGDECINLHHEMLQSGVQPNDVTFLGLLTGCKNSGLVEDGWNLFHSMRDHGIQPQQQHYASIVDLLGRAGQIDRAHEIIQSMPMRPSASIWGAMLTACQIHQHLTLGEYAAEQLFALDPDSVGQYVQLSNLYASCDLWSHVSKVRVAIKKKELDKDIGYSASDLDGKLEMFQAGDLYRLV